MLVYKTVDVTGAVFGFPPGSRHRWSSAQRVDPTPDRGPWTRFSSGTPGRAAGVVLFAPLDARRRPIIASSSARRAAAASSFSSMRSRACARALPP